MTSPVFIPSPQHPFNAIGRSLKEQMGRRVVKLSIDGGFTCPNRDGSKGTGGCLFCSAAGSGDLASDIPSQIRLLSSKWSDASYLAYFQSHTNTYAPAEQLRQQYEEALAYPGVIGLAIATRPDCLGSDVLDLLEEFNRKTFLWVELGLQTIHAQTAELINRCYPLDVYDRAVTELTARGIRVVTHLIFGLPGESRRQMLESVRYVCRDLNESDRLCGQSLSCGSVRPLEQGRPGGPRESNKRDGSGESARLCGQSLSCRSAKPLEQSGPGGLRGSDAKAAADTGGAAVPSGRQPGAGSSATAAVTPAPARRYIYGIKLHMLNVVRGSRMAALYPDYVPFGSIEEYVDLVVSALEIIPPAITIHRLSGDAPRPTLIAPEWSYKKRTILNSIHQTLRQRGTCQGAKLAACQDAKPDTCQDERPATRSCSRTR